MKTKKIIEQVIFSSKWLLLPFYLKLFWTLLKLLYHFTFQGELSNADLMQTIEDLDIVMIANLVKMIITGSYGCFIDKFHGVEEEKISSGALKVKMSASIIGVASVHLLKTFINVDNVSSEIIHKQLTIYGAFIVSAIALALIDYLHCKTKDQH